MSLLTNLVAAWEFNGDATDSHGANDLTATNSPVYGTGLVNTSALDLEASSSQYASIADNADVSTGDIDFTFEAWVKAESLPGAGNYPTILGKNDSNLSREYYLSFDGDLNRFDFGVSSNGSNNIHVAANAFGAPSTGTWYHIVAWHDSVNNQIGIAVNGVSDTASHSGGVVNGTNVFEVGRSIGGSFGAYWDGVIGPVRMWKRVLTVGERAELYNAGAGIPYAGLGYGAAVWNIMDAVWSAGTRTQGGPSDIAGNKLALLANRLALNDGDAVATWADASGNANDVTQATSGNRPSFQTNEINGLPAVDFDGVDDRLVRGSAMTSITGGFTLAVVASRRESGGTDAYGWPFSAGSSGDGLIFYGPSLLPYTLRTLMGGSDHGIGAAQMPSGYSWVTAVRTGTTVSTKLNGASHSSSTGSSSLTLGAPTLGARYDAAQFYDGAIAELLLYDSDLSSDLTRLNKYLSAKYALPGPAGLVDAYAAAVWAYATRTETASGPGTYTGTMTLSTDAATASASGTHTAPIYAATGAPSADAATAAASGTHTAPDYSATGAPSVDAAAAAASGTHTPIYAATGAPSVDAATAAASGTHTPIYAATGAPSTDAATSAASGTHTTPIYAATGAPSADAATATASGTHTAPIYAATGTPSTATATASASGTHTAPIYAATGAPSVDAAAAAASGTHTPIYAATGAPSVDAATAAASGTHTAPIFAATGAPSTDTATAAGSAVMTAAGYNGIGAPAVSEAVAAVSGAHAAPIYAGTSAVSTDAATAALSGAHAVPIYAGTAALTAEAAASSAAGLLVFVGSGAGSTVAAAAEAAGTFSFLGGSAAVSAEAAVASAAGSVTVPIYTGTAAATVTAVASAASGLSFSGIFFSADLTVSAAVGAAGGGFRVARYQGPFRQLRTGERALHLPRGARLPRRTVGFAFRTDGLLAYFPRRDQVSIETAVAAGSVIRLYAAKIDWDRTTAYVEAVVRDRTFGGPEFT